MKNFPISRGNFKIKAKTQLFRQFHYPVLPKNRSKGKACHRVEKKWTEWVTSGTEQMLPMRPSPTVSQDASQSGGRRWWRMVRMIRSAPFFTTASWGSTPALARWPPQLQVNVGTMFFSLAPKAADRPMQTASIQGSNAKLKFFGGCVTFCICIWSKHFLIPESVK